jgi:hypothetical protein
MTTEKEDIIIEKLLRCADECNRCMAACLNEDDVSEMARCIELNIDCAGICMLMAGYLSRNSESSYSLLPICAEVCEACAAECSRHDMDHCQKCASICRDCAAACLED